ncbi:MAG TPA: TIGR03435 family protein [Bryobacteraceae bacterium]|jgi:uncharacterized protein (TIGR03435 family)
MFQAADVHASPDHHEIEAMARVSFGGERYRIRTANMLELIANAYDIDAASVLGGPSWLEADRYDIVARTPANTSPDALKLMLRNLLSVRFGLKVHAETKTEDGYGLTVVKLNPQVKAAAGAESKGCQKVPDSSALNQSLSCQNTTMADFVRGLRAWASSVEYVGNLPIEDQTGLDGARDFTLRYSDRAMLAKSDDGISLFDAIQDQMGLKLERRNVTVPVVVVDSVNRMPTANAPNLALQLPPLKIKFEVADIRPSPPDTKHSFSIQAGGGVYAAGVTLAELLRLATNGDSYFYFPGMLAAPAWMDSKRFTIAAKAADNAGELTADDVRQMLGTLAADRFKIVSHQEDRPVDVYLLTASKPKLKAAEGFNRSTCKAGAPPGRSPAAALRTFDCQNMTMAQFAKALPSIAPPYFDHPLVEATGLAGEYDFSLTFSARRVAEAATADPTGAISLFDALDRQLGLKLELRKHSMPVTVIDHAEQMPTEN